MYYYVFIKFVYFAQQEAENAKTGLDGKRALGKKIIADWARVDHGAIKKNVSIVLVQHSDTCMQ